MSTLTDHLQAIRDEHGYLTPALVVDAARDTDHPLHSQFEWDDTAAAEKYRLHQASALLRITTRPIPGKPNDIRHFMAVRGENTPRSDYIPTTEALADPFTRKLVLGQFKREWLAFKRRYDDLEEFAAFILSDLKEKAS